MNPVKLMTICFLRKDINGVKHVCLAEKKRGFRAGKLNGYGGKQEPNETLEECALRETWEESGIRPRSIQKMGEVHFCDWDKTFICHVYVSEDWDGEPIETEEMDPAWYPLDSVPYERMGQADPLWIPQVLLGTKVMAMFKYDENDKMYFQEVKVGETEKQKSHRV